MADRANINGRDNALTRLRQAARVGDAASAALQTALRPARALGFPYRSPSVPKGVDVPSQPSTLGADFETDWARRSPARAARRVITEGPLRTYVQVLAKPEIVGTDRLRDLADRDDPPALIFAPTHHSHLDTPLVITSIPEPWRSKLVVAAAADYFFDKRFKGLVAALSLNAIPIDREVTGRKTSDKLRNLVDDGWSLVIYPEGGRSPDGWGQEFKGGAAYLSSRTGAAVVPMFLDGTGAIYGKGMKRPKPGATKVVFGQPLSPLDGESTRRFNARIEAAVTTLGDEALTDYWTALRRSAAGTSPKLTGPEYNGWRRQWALAEHRKLGKAGVRRRQKRRWPDLG
jgi:1-acyl-sn-glycerol-3-phosphate acyltransferase